MGLSTLPPGEPPAPLPPVRAPFKRWLAGLSGEALLILATVWLAIAYFGQAVADNQIARYDAIFAFVETSSAHRGTFIIDEFLVSPENHINTIDWARNPAHSPHYYANKAPGTLLLGVPIYTVLYHLQRVLGLTPESPQLTRLNLYLINLGVTALPVTLAAAVFYLTLLQGRLVANRYWAWLLTLATWLGTLLWPFSTILSGHSLAAAALTGSLWATFAGPKPRVILSGFFLGLAVLVDYSSVLVIPLWAVCSAWPHRHAWRAALVSLGQFALGGLPPLLIYMGYHAWCFGRPLGNAASFSNPVFLDAGNLGGLLGQFQVDALWGLTFSGFRGLFLYSPVLLVIVGGALLWGRALWHLAAVRLSAAVFVTLFVFNLSFNGWHGGASFGPRYLILALPCLGLLGAALSQELARGPAWRIRLYHGLLLVSLVPSLWHMLLGTAISPHSPVPPDDERQPLAYYYRAALANDWLPASGGAGTPFSSLVTIPLRLGSEWDLWELNHLGLPIPATRQRVFANHGTLDLAQAFPQLPPGGRLLAQAVFARHPLAPGPVGRIRAKLTTESEVAWLVQGRQVFQVPSGPLTTHDLHYQLPAPAPTLAMAWRATRPASLTAPWRITLQLSDERGYPLLTHTTDTSALASFNWGQFLGLQGPWSLLPLVLALAVLGLIGYRRTRRPSPYLADGAAPGAAS